MHKSENYGEILLKQKDKQTDQQIKNFAIKISKHTPYEVPEIEAAITELVREKVCFIEGDKLYQPRMVKDFQLSEARKKSGKKGVFAKAKKAAKPKNLVKQNTKQKPEYEDEYETDNENTDESELKGKKQKPKIEVILPFQTDRFREIWEEWKEYKKTELKKPYRTVRAEQRTLKGLNKDSGHDEETAIKMIERTMERGWTGIFPLDEQGGKTKYINGKSQQGSYDSLKRKLAEEIITATGNGG